MSYDFFLLKKKQIHYQLLFHGENNWNLNCEIDHIFVATKFLLWSPFLGQENRSNTIQQQSEGNSLLIICLGMSSTNVFVCTPVKLFGQGVNYQQFKSALAK